MSAVVRVLVLLLLVAGAVGMLRSLEETDRPPVDESSEPEPAPDPAVPVELGERRATSTAAADAAERRRRLDRLRALNEEGVRLLELDDFEGAIERFERCHAAAPENETYALNLSDALAFLALDLYQEGERALAVEHLERALATSPSRSDLARILERWRATDADEAELWRYETDHFELSFDGRRTDLLYGAQDVLDVLEAAYLEFEGVFGSDPVAAGRARIRVVVTSRPEFRRATGLGEWAGGAYDGTIRLPLDDLEGERTGWTRVLRHELGHVWTRHEGGRRVPGWLNEGLCQWLEGDLERTRAKARRALAGHEPFSLAELTGSLIHWEDPAAVGRAYAQAFLFLDQLVRTYGTPPVLAMLTGCRELRDPTESFEERTLVPLELAFVDFVTTLR